MEGHAAYLRTAVGTEFDAAAHALNQARGALEVLAAGKGHARKQMEQLEAAVHAAEVRAKRLTILLVAKDSAGGVTVVGAGHAPMSIVSTVRAAIR